jgi:lipoate-protein ligase B
VAELRDLGRVPYPVAHALQRELVDARARGEAPDTILLCTHDPVYTVGRRRDAAHNVLAPGDVPVVEVERGGDVTWHGPGQLVAYPILQLDGAGRDLHAHLHALEDVLIRTCAAFGLDAGRDARNTGCWVGGRKLGSVGIACRRWVTWHGLSLNVDCDLEAFRRIHPCGMDAEVVTTMSVAAARALSVDEVRPVLAASLLAVFGESEPSRRKPWPLS